MFAKLMDGFVDGECSFGTVVEAFNIAEKMITSQLDNLAGWRTRLNAAKRNQEVVG
jgi:hypothetical protein